MKDPKEIYQQLRETYSDEEIATDFVVEERLPPAEQQAAKEEFLRLRLERLQAMTPIEKLASNLWQLKYQIRLYLDQAAFQASFKFGKQLKRYIAITQRSQKTVAQELNIHPTKLSRIVNGKEKPNVELMYRLEQHSSGEIPAEVWWRLHAIELEHHIKTDLHTKLQEADQVSNPLKISA
ncbi:MAG: helix-turn-helix transcriptional regulator [Bacteroidota bacterium]